MAFVSICSRMQDIREQSSTLYNRKENKEVLVDRQPPSPDPACHP
jgi:hypothetical protein